MNAYLETVTIKFIYMLLDKYSKFLECTCTGMCFGRYLYLELSYMLVQI